MPDEVSTIGVKLTLDASGFSSGLEAAGGELNAFQKQAAQAGAGVGGIQAGARPGGKPPGSAMPVDVTLSVSSGAISALRKTVAAGLQGIPVTINPQFASTGKYSVQNLMGAVLSTQYGITPQQGRQAALAAIERAQGSLPIKKMALGGYAAAGRAVVVGEHRPEVIEPKTASIIHPSIRDFYRKQEQVRRFELELAAVDASRQRQHEQRLAYARFGRRVVPLPAGVPMPLPLGEAPLREGYVRAYHRTRSTGVAHTPSVRSAKENLDSIRQHGLRLSRAEGHNYGEPDFNWFSNKFDYGADTGYGIEAHLPARWFDWSGKKHRSDPYTIGGPSSNMAVGRDISRRRIVSWNEPWMRTYRRLMEDYGDRPLGDAQQTVGKTIRHLRGVYERDGRYEGEVQGWDQFIAQRWRSRHHAMSGKFRAVPPERFYEAISKARSVVRPSGRAVGETVYQYPLEEYARMRTYLTKEGTAGYALKPHGEDTDLVSVFNVGGRGMGKAAVRSAIQRGATTLDAFDEVSPTFALGMTDPRDLQKNLPRFYGQFGFREVGRDPWNPDYAPEGWQGGTPDVVYMRRASAKLSRKMHRCGGGLAGPGHRCGGGPVRAQVGRAGVEMFKGRPRFLDAQGNIMSAERYYGMPVTARDITPGELAAYERQMASFQRMSPADIEEARAWYPLVHLTHQAISKISGLPMDLTVGAAASSSPRARFPGEHIITARMAPRIANMVATNPYPTRSMLEAIADASRQYTGVLAGASMRSAEILARQREIVGRKISDYKGSIIDADVLGQHGRLHGKPVPEWYTNDVWMNRLLQGTPKGVDPIELDAEWWAARTGGSRAAMDIEAATGLVPFETQAASWIQIRRDFGMKDIAANALTERMFKDAARIMDRQDVLKRWGRQAGGFVNMMHEMEPIMGWQIAEERMRQRQEGRSRGGIARAQGGLMARLGEPSKLASAFEAKAAEMFGFTEDPMAAGWLAPSGQYVDFSALGSGLYQKLHMGPMYENTGMVKGTRTIPHVAARHIVGTNTPYEQVYEKMLDSGFLRMAGFSPRFFEGQMSSPLTFSQRSRLLADLKDYEVEEMFLDLTSHGPHPLQKGYFRSLIAFDRASASSILQEASAYADMPWSQLPGKGKYWSPDYGNIEAANKLAKVMGRRDRGGRARLARDFALAPITKGMSWGQGWSIGPDGIELSMATMGNRKANPMMAMDPIFNNWTGTPEHWAVAMGDLIRRRRLISHYEADKLFGIRGPEAGKAVRSISGSGFEEMLVGPWPKRMRKMAAGGDTLEGAYIVGEIGKELFVPDTLAHLIPKKVMDQIPKAKGGMQVIGTRRDHALGGELFFPPEDGIIVPNRLMDQVPRAAEGARTDLYATTRDLSTGRITANARIGEGAPLPVNVMNWPASIAQAQQTAGALTHPPMGGGSGLVSPPVPPSPPEPPKPPKPIPHVAHVRDYKEQQAYFKSLEAPADAHVQWYRDMESHFKSLEAPADAHVEQYREMERQRKGSALATARTRPVGLAPERAQMYASMRQSYTEAAMSQSARTPRGYVAQLAATFFGGDRGENLRNIAEQRRTATAAERAEARIRPSAVTAYIQKQDELTHARGAEAVKIQEQIDRLIKHNPLLTDWIKKTEEHSEAVRKGLPGLGAGLVGLGKVIAGIQLYSWAMEGVSMAAAAADPAARSFVDQVRGWSSISSTMTTALGKQTDAASGNVTATMNQFVANNRLSGSLAALAEDTLTIPAAVKAGATAGTKIEDTVKALMGAGSGAPAGTYGGYGGVFEGSFLAELLGGGKGGMETVLGSFRAANPPEKVGLDRTLEELVKAGQSVAHSFGLAESPYTDLNPDQEQALKARAGLIENLNQAADRAQKKFGGALVTWEEATDAQIEAVKAGKDVPDYIKQLAEEQRVVMRLGDELVTTKAQADVAAPQTIAGLGLMPPDAWAKETMRRLQAQWGAADIMGARQREVGIPYSMWQQVTQNPFIAPSAGISMVGASGAAQAFAGRRFTATSALQQDFMAQARLGLARQRQEIRDELSPEDVTIFNDATSEAKSLSRTIAGLTTEMLSAQKAASDVSFANQFRLAQRALGDALGMLGQIGGTRLGYLQREEWLTSRASQSLGLASQKISLASQNLSLMLQARSIATNLAVAQFQAPGETGEERYARQREAIIRAGIEKQQLGYGRQQFGISQEQYGLATKQFVLAGQIWSENAQRAAIDARRSLQVMQASRNAEVIAAAANKQASAAAQSMGQYLQKAGEVAQRAERRKNDYTTAIAEGAFSLGQSFMDLAKEMRNAIDVLNGKGVDREQERQRNLTSTLPGAQGRPTTSGRESEGGTVASRMPEPVRRNIAGGRSQVPQSDFVGASGFLGNVSRATSFTAGEAGNETVAILRNPRMGSLNMDGGGGGIGPMNLTVNINGPVVRDEREVGHLARRVAEEVERVLARKGQMMGLRRPAY